MRQLWRANDFRCVAFIPAGVEGDHTVCRGQREPLRIGPNGVGPMETVLYHLTTVAVLAVLFVLILGLINLWRGKDPNLSQKLMRWRVGLQALAIVIIILFSLVHYGFR